MHEFNHGKALKRIERNFIFVVILGIFPSATKSGYSLLNFLAGTAVSIISYYLIKIVADSALKRVKEQNDSYGRFFGKFFTINLLLFAIIYGIKILPVKDVLFLSLGVSVVIISIFIEIFYEIFMGR